MFVQASTKEPGTWNVPSEYKLGVNGAAEVPRHCCCHRAHRKWAEPLQFLVWGSFHSTLSLPLGSVLGDGRPTPRPREGLQLGVQRDLSSCGLTKESRSWISKKHELRR